MCPQSAWTFAHLSCVRGRSSHAPPRGSSQGPAVPWPWNAPGSSAGPCGRRSFSAGRSGHADPDHGGRPWRVLGVRCRRRRGAALRSARCARPVRTVVDSGRAGRGDRQGRTPVTTAFLRARTTCDRRLSSQPSRAPASMPRQHLLRWSAASANGFQVLLQRRCHMSRGGRLCMRRNTVDVYAIGIATNGRRTRW